MSQATSDYISGSISIQGLGNDTNWLETIDKLRQIEEIPARRLLKWKADWQERQEAFRVVRQQLVSLREIAAGMNSVEKFMTKAVSSSKSDVATGVAKSAAQEGVYKLEVNQLATNSIWSVDTGFDELTSKVNSGSGPTNFTYQYAGKTRTISIAAGTTLEGLKNLINNDAQNPGVRVSLVKGADGYTFQMRGMDLGSANALHITYTDLNGFPPPSDYANAEYKLSFDTGLANSTDSVNDSGEAQTFSFTYNGKKISLSVADGTTLEGLRDAINASGNGNIASIEASGGQQTLKFTVPQGSAVTFNETADSGLIAGLKKPSESFTPSSFYTATISTGLSTPQDMVNGSGGVKNFVLTHGGVQYTFQVPNDSTLSDFVELINSNTSTTNVKASLGTGADGKQELKLDSLDGKTITVAADPAMTGVTGMPAYSAPTTSGWYVQQSQDAKIRINGWPAGSWLTVGSNTVDNVDEGMTFTLKDVGTTTLTVNTDTEKIKENVLTFIEAVNSFRATILELTKLDTSKQTTDPSLATSLYDMQKGSILTGNYGVQLLSSQLKQATAGMPLGFMPMKEIEGYLTGDMFTSLSQLGIKTEASGEGSLNYGMLVLNTDTDLPTLDSVLAKNPLAVAEFFAAKNQGVSDSANFSFMSQIESITVPGSYDVKYEIGTDGKVVDGTAFINGKPAKYYEDTGEIALVRQDPSSSNSAAVTAKHLDGTADGDYTIDVLNLAKGASVSADTGLTASNLPLSASEEEFSLKLNGKEISYTVAAGETLDDFVTRMNKVAKNPFTMSIDTSGGTAALVFTSKETGADMAVSDFTGLSGWTAGTPAAGDDAHYTINGGAVKSSKTNTVTNAVKGLELTLKGETGGTPATITAQKYNAADGIRVHPDNLTPGSYTGTVRIKQGKINELLRLLDGPPNKPEEGMLGSKGALQILQDNYDDIIASIDAKVEREDARITKWTRLMKLRFARLDATLKQYDSLSKSIESQIKTLSSGSSS